MLLAVAVAGAPHAVHSVKVLGNASTPSGVTAGEEPGKQGAVSAEKPGPTLEVALPAE